MRPVALALLATLLIAAPATAQFAGTVGGAAAAGAASGASRAAHSSPHGGGGGSGGTSKTMAWTIGVTVALVCLCAVLLHLRDRWRGATSTRTTGSRSEFIRITNTPPGEAPEEIRRAWVGSVLHVHPNAPGLRRSVGAGVLTGESANLTEGYWVDAAVAVATLATFRPDAAAWWRTNASHLLAPGGCLVFPAEVCELVGTTT